MQRPKMPIKERAKIFAPFDALKGFREMLASEEIIKEDRIELTEDEFFIDDLMHSFVVDENGDLLLVYHARPTSHFDKQCGTYCDEPLYDPCRHARIKKVIFDQNGTPVLR